MNVLQTKQKKWTLTRTLPLPIKMLLLAILTVLALFTIIQLSALVFFKHLQHNISVYKPEARDQRE